MTKAIAACLCYNSPDLVESILSQLPGCQILDNGSRPALQNANYRTSNNLFFVGGWNLFMKALLSRHPDADYIWMLNSDIQGISGQMLNHLAQTAENQNAAIVTPAFNSPHWVFHPKGSEGSRPVPWIDWCCPLVKVSAWKTVGPFDAAVDGYGADLDWCWRGREYGLTYYVDDSQVVIHLGSVTTVREGITNQADVARMDDFLCQKWHVSSWVDLTV